MDYHPTNDGIVSTFGGMNPMQISYRLCQLWQALGKKPANNDLELVESVLTPSEISLFQRMDPSEQVHSIRVLRSLIDKGERQSDLLKAALLHDVGKSCFPLRLWERGLIVLAKAIFPQWVVRWGSKPLLAGQPPSGWRRGFIISQQHAEWGAQMTEEVGMSPLAASLIRYHQDGLPSNSLDFELPEHRLLLALQAADEES
jgi:hypothetical protein